MRILMVDDEELILNSMCGYVEEHFDVELYRAESGLEAMSLLQKIRFDVVVTDISMPLMDGIELMKNIKRMWPECFVIILTVYDKFDYAYQLIKYDRVDYVLKADSFPGIHQALLKVSQALDEENRQRQMMLRISEHIDKVKPQMRDEIVKRLLRRQSTLPTEAELSVADFGLRMSRGVLLATGVLDTDNYLQMANYLPQIAGSIRGYLNGKGVDSRFFQNGYYMASFFQPSSNDEASCQTIVTYVKDAFEQLSDSMESSDAARLAVAMKSRMLKWDELSEVYDKEIIALENIRNTNAVVIVPDIPQSDSRDNADCLTIDDVNLLWEYIKMDKSDQFRQLLMDRLAGLSDIPDMTAALPNASVSALCFLYVRQASETGREWENDVALRSTINCSSHASGAQWISDILYAFDLLFLDRDKYSRSGIDNLIDRINEYVNRHYTEDIHLTTIAEEFYYSAAYISRVYKEVTGNNLSSVITAARISRSKTLLETTQLPIGDIARESGFYSTKYYLQVFKRKTGMTPSQYRKISNPRSIKNEP